MFVVAAGPVTVYGLRPRAGAWSARSNRGARRRIQERNMADHGDRKTRPTDADVVAFLEGITDDRRRAEAFEVLGTRAWNTNHVEGPEG